MSNSSWSIFGFVVLLVSVLPAMHAYNLTEPLSATAYLWTALAGSLIGYPLVFRLLRVLEEGSLGRRIPHVTSAASGLFLAPPMWGIGILMTLNVVFDTSAPEEHPTVYLRQERCKKNSVCPYFASWTDPGEETKLRAETAYALRSQDGTWVAPGTNVIVVTRKGLLGFEYVVSVRKQ